MAQHKVGNRIFEEEEYELETISTWAFYLFVIGAIVSGLFMRDVMSDDWSKELRYFLLISVSIASGTLLGYLSVYIRQLFYMLLFVGAMSGVLYYAWTII